MIYKVDPFGQGIMAKDEGSSTNPIPKDIALQLCAEIRKEKAGKLFTQCWGCVKATKGNPDKMCVNSRPDYRGCAQVNARYDRSRKL
jgi:hypothetical protein